LAAEADAEFDLAPPRGHPLADLVEAFGQAESADAPARTGAGSCSPRSMLASALAPFTTAANQHGESGHLLALASTR
jgi:hypothetical protein